MRAFLTVICAGLLSSAILLALMYGLGTYTDFFDFVKENKDILPLLLPILSLTISVLAFAASGVTLYRNYFYQNISFNGCLLACDSQDRDDARESRFEFSIANNGNCDLLLRDVEITLLGDGHGANNLTPIDLCDTMPLILKKDEIQLLTLQIPRLFIRNVTAAHQRIQLVFQIYSVSGGAYPTKKNLGIVTPYPAEDGLEFVLEEASWNPFSLSSKG